jgi:ribosomal protein S18 acetylase RimI-like enzyme
MDGAPFQIVPVRSSGDLAAVGALFDAYAASIGVDLSYQDFQAERAGLPGKYAPPGGDLLLGRTPSGTALGCVALRPLSGPVCEMKRLYVSPEARGLGLGAALTEAVVGVASRLNYRELRLDTLPTMRTAIALYERLGFTRIEPYYATPVAGTVFLARSLP